MAGTEWPDLCPILAGVDGMNSQSRGIRGGREASLDDLDGFVEESPGGLKVVAALVRDSESVLLGVEDAHTLLNSGVFVETAGQETDDRVRWAGHHDIWRVGVS